MRVQKLEGLWVTLWIRKLGELLFKFDQIQTMESDLDIFDESTLITLSVCSPPPKEDYADDVARNSSSMGEANQHPAPDGNAAPKHLIDINNLPPFPSVNDEEIAALLDDYTNEEIGEESIAKGISSDHG
jgi:hypothetical protein